ncbi:SCO family protein [Dictyobacter vulcani]|uniref:SCO family protein n=1 Tax=Dictyobacter vulcani TaxID=2607529 RepID=A0A5J4KJT7_9CHLR|nr:SCO family protein [Dictyobacter vulcani]GER87272.1 SCO family protein [Dictyobacter vulcani]
MSWRLASRLSVITLAILVVIIVTVIQQKQSQHVQTASTAATSPSGLQGTDLGGTPAPNFQLTDQYGKPVSLAQFHGKPVVVTFLYTHCPDVCPLTAENLHTTLQQMGSDAKNVAIIAVSTDPKRDTTAEALKFSTEHNMQAYWHFLTGTQKELSPIWSSYSIYAQQMQQKVNHSTALYLIDKQGKERVYMGDDFKPAQMAANLQQLLKEK